MSRARNKRPPSLAAFVAGGARWWVVFLFAFFLLFPFLGRPTVQALAFVLDGLNNFGSGWR